MLKLNLILRRKSDDILIFSPAPWFRFLFIFLTIIIATGIITIKKEGASESILIPVIIGTICIAASLYEESWRFDRENNIVTSKSGLIFINKKTHYSFSEIKNLQLTLFLRGAESDGSADHEIDLMHPFSKKNTEEVSGINTKIIHRKWHQELRLNLKTGKSVTIERIDSKGNEVLSKKAGVISDFTGLKLVK